MKKIKELFSTPKRIAISVACIIGIVAILSTGSILIAQAFAENTSIGADNAKNFAFADAEIDPVSAKNVKVKFEFEQGQFVYEVEFDADGTEYEYWIKASDGSVVKKQQEIVTSSGANVMVSARITLDAAKEAALKDAGVSASEVTFTSEKLDVDDRLTVYDIEFNTKDTEYEYEINADSGEIYSKSKEPVTLKPAGTAAPSAKPQASQTPAAQSSAAPTTTPQATTQPKPSSGSGGAQPGGSNTGNTETAGGSSNSSTGNSGTGSSSENSISLDQAKAIAAQHAGFSASDVNFSKAKMDHDDGHTVYEIEFYKDGVEYEYEINASTGAIIDYDSEWDD